MTAMDISETQLVATVVCDSVETAQQFNAITLCIHLSQFIVPKVPER